MSAGTLTSLGLVDFYLSCIGTLDQKWPTVNSVFEVNPDARSIADKALYRARQESNRLSIRDRGSRQHPLPAGFVGDKLAKCARSRILNRGDHQI